MDLLTRLVKLALVAVALVVTSCIVGDHLGWNEPKDERPAFPHSKHAEDAGLECSSCHRRVETEEEAGMPSPNQCRLCHEEIDAEKPAELHAAAFFGEDGKPKRLARSHLDDELIFSHKVHVTDHSLACADCHGDVAPTDRVPDDVGLTMDECMACHARAGKSNDCAECHREIHKDRAPRDHETDWIREHGRRFRFEPDFAQSDCALCHARNQCESCHRTEQPSDHTNYFRRRGHGVQVAIDRSRCATCHTSDSCERCHQETAPISHAAGWGSPRNRHCITCHAPLGAEQGCGVCHHGNPPSHALAAPLPPDHTPGMNCRMCHGLTAPLPHPDKGDSCSACHN